MAAAALNRYGVRDDITKRFVGAAVQRLRLGTTLNHNKRCQIAEGRGLIPVEPFRGSHPATQSDDDVPGGMMGQAVQLP